MINDGINGIFLAELNDDQLIKTLNGIGIKNEIHVMNMCAQFKALKNKASGGVTVVKNAAGILEKVATVVHGLDLPTRVSVTPRKIMSDLFAIQGIELDPSYLDPAIDKIVTMVGSSGGVCDGVKSFDLFINYRVAADADVAEKLYLYLKTKGINAFLDKKCLKAGEPWKEGFLSGLSRSRMFLCLISSPALANVRDKTKNHEWDNVLLEYETALLIQRHLAEVDVDLARAYIMPVHVGQFSQGVLTKFTDFNSMMYPDSVGPESDHVDTVASTTSTAAVMDITTCEGTFAALQIPLLGPAEAEAALKAIGNLCRLDKENGVALDKLGACEMVVKMLLIYATSNAFVAAEGCYAVHSLANDNKERKDKLVAAGVVVAVFKSLRSFPVDADVALHGCWAIVNLAGSDDINDKLLAAGVAEEVIKALRAFPTNPEVVKWGCRAIVNLSSGDDDRTGELVAAGAVDEVIKALQAFPANAEMAEIGCSAIGNLAGGGDDIKDKLVAAGTIEVLIKALRAFPVNAEINQYGCLAIANLAGDNHDRADKLVAGGVIGDVINALQFFPENTGVVKWGCIAIHNLAIDSNDRKDRLVASGAKTLLEAALNNHVLAQEARDEAKDALDLLEV